MHFYSRPCGRGDADGLLRASQDDGISTHAPAGGATSFVMEIMAFSTLFLLTPLREGRPDFFRDKTTGETISTHAPAGGATGVALALLDLRVFLLTPLREGRQ